MPDFSILIPHLNNDVGRRALRVCLDTIVRHTCHDYELMVQAQQGDNAYPQWNRMARSANTDWLIFTVTDQFVSPHWDVPLWEARATDMLVVSGLVESGYRPVSGQNIERSFGISPETYDEAGFNAFAAEKPELPAGDSWMMPMMVHRQTFLDFGGFDLHPSLSDMFFFQRWLSAGHRWTRVQSYSYHLMSWSLTGATR
jgi:hypothetical protein